MNKKLASNLDELQQELTRITERHERFKLEAEHRLHEVQSEGNSFTIARKFNRRQTLTKLSLTESPDADTPPFSLIAKYSTIQDAEKVDKRGSGDDAESDQPAQLSELITIDKVGHYDGEKESSILDRLEFPANPVVDSGVPKEPLGADHPLGADNSPAPFNSQPHKLITKEHMYADQKIKLHFNKVPDALKIDDIGGEHFIALPEENECKRQKSEDDR
ncbi:unnamed protein product [Protopolystoma xenopodis]|uniref:Uncharacterized protein n=1 Tax=Protopolystoma xenopodis TaxID=117903 RepID=A0A448X836_9PLAT|nr:unnamed protein product [Protopolystoma xenopodis]